MQQHDRQSTEFLLAMVDRSRHGKKKEFGGTYYCILKKSSTVRSHFYRYIT
ncbi:hypothetical protein [Microcoleus vaginatus]|uniref:hypothetical protein n=1 Tax=Microcoleus vaginatus TaxID=119532 RepID=UPI001F605F57